MAEIKSIAAAAVPNQLVTGAKWLASIPPLVYFAKPILQMSQLITMTAPTNTGKSAVTAMIIAAALKGEEIGGIKFRKGCVLALLGENAENARLQLKAAMLAYGVSEEDQDNLVIFPLCKSMEQTVREVKAEVVAKKLGPFVLVSIDTVAAYFGGEDENSNAQVRKHAAFMREFTKPVFGSPCVLANSHPTKDARRDNLLPRGGGALVAEIDSNLTLWNDSGLLTLHYTKLRGIPFDPVMIELVPQSVGFSDGTVTDVVVGRIISESDALTKRLQARSEDELLLECIGAKPDATQTQWAEALGWKDGQGRPYRVKVQRTLKRLEAEGKIRKDATGSYIVKRK